jgi:hypothetical protein
MTLGWKDRLHVGAVLPLADAREAHFMLERVRPQPKGKIVLRGMGTLDAGPTTFTVGAS